MTGKQISPEVSRDPNGSGHASFTDAAEMTDYGAEEMTVRDRIEKRR